MKSSEKNGHIDYIEMNVSDLGRSKAFYGEAFGFAFTDYGPTYAAFESGISGGLTTQAKPNPGGPLVILYADDLEAMQKRVESAGGKMVRPIFAFPGGRRFHFADPDGYELAVWSLT